MNVQEIRGNIQAMEHFDPAQHHLVATPDSKVLQLRKEGIEDAYGWAYNSWLDNPIGMWFKPSNAELFERETTINYLSSVFSTSVCSPEYCYELTPQALSTLSKAVLTSIKAAKVGYSVTCSLKSAEIYRYNGVLEGQEQFITAHTALMHRRLQNLTLLRNSMRGFDEWTGRPVDIRSLCLAYCRAANDIYPSDVAELATFQREFERCQIQLLFDEWKDHISTERRTTRWNIGLK